METTGNMTQTAEKQLILLPLNDYLEGRPVKDIERLRRAFHPEALIRMVVDGKLAQWTVPQYLDAVEKAALMECQTEILSYTWDGDTASALVQLIFPTFKFIDRFNLVKLEGKWLIMDKISYRQVL
ncbi:putative lumazine-binding protein [Chitinophaga dinghuensis]|uniref:Putative lumazine-binding protein n=1 Tax=Chitinophaga dinghuensis TaxID=1539050 RepID=A0A327VZK5_9BACT|nr:nuclear transport factor 2 family protein [Chitinophaga dinghuensis]RAJ80396.1 putative lumazine-binding protein [Chitinophaga dinghuensis]